MQTLNRRIDIHPVATWLWPAGLTAAAASLVLFVAPVAQLAVAIVGALLIGTAMTLRERALWKLCLTDPLTGLANRRGFELHFKDSFTRGLHEGESMALLLVDCDHFKQLNDRHGHAAGDRALKALVQSLRSSVRTEDLVGRWGGDEFVVLLRDADEEVVRHVADRVNRALASFTVSVGCVVRDATQVRRVRLGRLLSAADRALYLAKRRGGGQLAVVGKPRFLSCSKAINGGES
ncbi:MAG: GGDEF domain-containing protein [Archangium sp.]